MNVGRTPNHLIHEKSPYLLQHAYNPVAWYPWSEEAFAKARRENKPVFLSVGYATCHWCHVMEHESFENDSIAALLNEFFVSVKVDREERPDVDRLYMTALQAMGQNGGWPMSMFLTPDRKPFYGGTYFPPETRYGRAGFPDVLRRIANLWATDRERVLESGAHITLFLSEAAAASASGTLADTRVPDTCFARFQRTYDERFGGFGGGPKFPRPPVFEFLLRYHTSTGNRSALAMTATTLLHMAAGGMYDHVGGGFHRYTVDGEWRVPHFEKMLYDQAQLVQVYLSMYQCSREEIYARTAREVLAYVRRDLTDPKGGFYSAEDADSQRPDAPPEDHGEGAFYVWTKDEILRILGKNEGERFCAIYGVEEGGNVAADPQHEFTGMNILFRPADMLPLAERFGMEEHALLSFMATCCERLRIVRSTRPRPLRDDKILTSWNGLMIGAFARASQILGNAEYCDVARRGAAFVLDHLTDPASGGLLRRYRDGEAKFDGHLEDFAFFVSGLLDLFEATGEARWLGEAVRLTQMQVATFSDTTHGGFFDTSGKDPSILVRMKELYDGAEPSGNSVAARNLLRLADLTEKQEWREEARRTLLGGGKLLAEQPDVMPLMVSLLRQLHTPGVQIVLTGDPDSGLSREVASHYLPDVSLLRVANREERDRVAEMVPFLAALPLDLDKPTAYVCEDHTCSLPTADVSVLRSRLQKSTPDTDAEPGG